MTVLSGEKQYLTPPEVAELLGVGHPKVLSWIDSGELRSYDISTNRDQRPRYKIARDDLEKFLARRSTTPEPEKRGRKRKQQDDTVINFYK